ncbi:hypothetical protein GEMRC1_011274 [Eukaryota sp. GEM-RC1]
MQVLPDSSIAAPYTPHLSSTKTPSTKTFGHQTSRRALADISNSSFFAPPSVKSSSSTVSEPESSSVPHSNPVFERDLSSDFDVERLRLLSDHLQFADAFLCYEYSCNENDVFIPYSPHFCPTDSTLVLEPFDIPLDLL